MAMKSFSGIWRGLATCAVIALVLAPPAGAQAAPARAAEVQMAPQAQAPKAVQAPAAAARPTLAPMGPLPQTGCTVTGTSAVCDLWAMTGTVVLPGAAAAVPIWGFASTSAGPATAPGPVLVVDQGTSVTI